MWPLPFCPGLGLPPGVWVQLPFQADSLCCFCSPCSFCEQHVTIFYHCSLPALDLSVGSISKVSFLTLLLWLVPSQTGPFLMWAHAASRAILYKATWYSQVPHANPCSKSRGIDSGPAVLWDLHQPLVSSFMSELHLLQRAGLLSITFGFAIPFFLWIFICMFSIRILFCFFLPYL